MSTLRVCEECSQALPEDRAVGCPRCLFALALAPPRRFEPQAFGNYELLEETGSGSMGVVYRASQVALDRPVAIKMIKAGIFATEQQVRRFRSEARAAARLQHPNVVRIFEVGEHDGRHFFSMDLVEGASLARLLAEGPLEPDRAARYLKAVAEAMAHAHQKGVFHRDLKPSNVLLDCFDQPRVTDFGLARHVEFDSSQTATGEVLGTPSFMPPEQALGQNRGADGSDDPARSDVYSMGATLYALVCGRPPFHGKTALETLRRVIDLEPTEPRQLNPSVSRDLETICLTCLSKDPAGRYASAKELADDLGRFLARQPILAQRPGPAGRLVLWTKRSPAAAATSGLGAVLGVLVLLGTLSLRADQLDGNRYSAEHVAPSVLQRFQGWGSLLVSAAESEPLRRALGSADQPSLEQFAATTRAAAGTAFESVIVLDENGKVLARDPPMPSMVGRSFERRDYFRGASRQRGQHGVAAVHISRVFPGQFDNLVKFAVSMPIRDGAGSGALLGVVAATIAADSTMGLPFLHDGQRTAAVVGRWDLERQPGDVNPFAVEPTRVVVLHPAFKHGDSPLAANSLVLAQFSSNPAEPELAPSSWRGVAEGNYVDPMWRKDLLWAGPWLAGMAQVGNTEFSVVVQTRDWIGLALVGSLALFAMFGALWLLVRQRGAWGRRQHPGEKGR